jgi:thiol-disulfide isomerase/thioredoxin
MKTQRKNRGRSLIALAALLATLVLAACGSGGSSGVDPGNAADAPDFTKVTKDAPPPLASLYADAGQVLSGGSDAYQSALASVKGYGAVVNVWASWCGPCHSELPHLQDAAAKYLDQVAFIGIDSDDDDASATTFLKDHPQPYPSFSDPHHDLADSIDPSLVGQPHTVFYDSAGQITHINYGPYTSDADLEADIEQYALGTSS